MANAIKKSGDGLALQITRSARAATLVDEDDNNTATRLAKTRIHAFEGLLVAVDVDRVPDDVEADLVATAATDTNTAYRAVTATIQIAGNGYQLQLPNAVDAGLDEGDTPTVTTAPGVLIIAHNETDTGITSVRVGEDLATIRREQHTEASR
ncbi:hypothetical protein PNQ29_03320 [Halobacterium salinarum]|uniref:hypothetical protein n=1 Tax=Halobacterium salinarum TaxID=2242 RepID=UPI0025534F18|nr:hypothetical protein [Halobacterium salinarum]MDL0118501.1 hypothetical protein [Halobacterium salinarum]MDL0118714.1 hypothetical protein [Halobacterium salinarum]MDL0118774.1 hypothetical protein [Halobacterium salinarum]